MANWNTGHPDKNGYYRCHCGVTGDTFTAYYNGFNSQTNEPVWLNKENGEEIVFGTRYKDAWRQLYKYKKEKKVIDTEEKYYVMRSHSHTDKQKLWKVMSRGMKEYQSSEDFMDTLISEDDKKNKRNRHEFFIVKEVKILHSLYKGDLDGNRITRIRKTNRIP